MRATQGGTRRFGWAALAAAVALAAPGAAAAQTIHDVPWRDFKKGLYFTGSAAYSYAQSFFLRGDNNGSTTPRNVGDTNFTSQLRTNSRQTYSVGVGYYLTDTVHLELSYTSRDGYNGATEPKHEMVRIRPFPNQPTNGYITEETWSIYELDVENIKTQTLMLTMYKDMPSLSFYDITPYFGLGLGYGHNSIGSISYTDHRYDIRYGSANNDPNYYYVTEPLSNWSGFVPPNKNYSAAFQAAFGFNYERTERLAITVGYRFVHLGDVVAGLGIESTYPLAEGEWFPTDDSLGGALQVHELTFGTKVSF